MKRATLHTDGGARGNPGPAAIGYVLMGVGATPIHYKEYIGKGTNNQAEYKALLAGMTRAKKEGVEDLRCYLDSELVVKQVRGEYRIKNEELKALLIQIQKLFPTFPSLSFHHIPRAKNAVADKLVNEALDANT